MRPGCTARPLAVASKRTCSTLTCAACSARLTARVAPRRSRASRRARQLSACYVQLGLLGAALESADAAVAAKPTWPKAHYRRGVALSAIELWPEASRAFERALAAEPGNKQLQSAAARAREKCGALPRVGGAYTLTWGRGEFGALGHGDVRDRALPRALEAAHARAASS